MATAEEVVEQFNRVSQGNVGALHVLVRLRAAKRMDIVDRIEKLKLSPEEIWMLYKDESHENLDELIGRIVGMCVTRGV